MINNFGVYIIIHINEIFIPHELFLHLQVSRKQAGLTKLLKDHLA